MRKVLITLACFAAIPASAQTNRVDAPVQIAGTHLCAPLASDCGINLPSLRTPEPAFTLRKDVSEVRVEFSVTDKHGRHISSLTPSDFQLSDDGVPITNLTEFRQESDIPIHVVILIDSSRSTAHELPAEKQLAVGFLRNLLRSQDRAMIAGFSTHLSMPGSFTNQIDQLEESVREMKSEGLTAFNDSMFDLASSDFDHPTLARKVVVVITDGHDSVSRRNFKDALDAVLRHDVTVYTISVNDKKSLYPAECLSQISAETGGHSYIINDINKLKGTFDQINSDLRSYYVAAFRAPTDDRSSFHTLSVQVATKGLNVQNKKGYFLSK